MKESFLSNQYLQKSIQKRNDEFDVAFKISIRKVTLKLGFYNENKMWFLHLPGSSSMS